MRPLLVVAATVVLAACETGGPLPDASEGPTGTAACGAVETFPIQGEGHLVGSQTPPVPYNSKPPTSGWHSSTDVPIVTAPTEDPLTKPEQVTVLELGGVVVSHGAIPSEERATLERLVADDYGGQAALTAYDELGDGEVVMSAWGVLQRCSELDLAAVEAFIAHYAQR